MDWYWKIKDLHFALIVGGVNQSHADFPYPKETNLLSEKLWLHVSSTKSDHWVSSEWIELKEHLPEALVCVPESYPIIKFWDSKAHNTALFSHPRTAAPRRSGPWESGLQPLPVMASNIWSIGCTCWEGLAIPDHDHYISLYNEIQKR